ncbi:ABC transporter permease [Acetobacterium bakii]|uniref:ABC transporter permease n=1 Tax=Acetobacterium bakii TaxID=52689 RepID=A0A0L6TYD1_9FIRM|nr:FtsX-like permease family protein [Acetobacterium bakii]KNZ41279.1 ABC transporter permease [Acetobacterium bakii]
MKRREKIKNNNKRIIGHLAARSLRTSKTRNIFILLTIALSVGLLGVMTLAYSGTVVERNKEISVMQHVIYENLADPQIKALENTKKIDFLTLAKLGQGFEINGGMVRPVYYEEITEPIQTNSICEGTYPQNIHEIAVNRSFMNLMGLSASIGETVSLTFLDGESEAFVVAGFLEGGEVTKVYPVLFSKEYAEAGSQLKDIPYQALCRIQGAEKQSEQAFLETIRTIGADAGVERKNINENNNFSSSLTMSAIDVLVIAGVGVGILLVSVLVVYSVFYLSVAGRIQQYGQLRTLGATKRQIKALVNREGIILCIAGAVSGLLIAWLIAYCIKPQGWNWEHTLILSLVIFLADLITVFVSIRKPAKLAASVSAIEASGFSQYRQNGEKESKKILRKLTPLNLAVMSAMRNRKKTLLTMISLGVGGVLLLTGAAFIVSMTPEDYSRQGFYQWGEFVINYDYNATQTVENGNVGIQMNNPLNDELIASIQGINGVKDVLSFNKTQISYDYKDEINATDSLAPFTRENQENVKDALAEGSFDYDEMIAKDEILIANNTVADEIFGWKFEMGDIVTIRYFNGVEEVEKEFTIVGSMDTLSEQLILDKTSFTLLNKMILGLSIFIIGFSLINLINTLITNIVSRRQEFSMLQSIGMSNRQLMRMIQGEGLILALGNLVITLILGTGAGYLMVYLLRSVGATYMHYRFPSWYFMGYVLVTLLVPVFVSGASVRAFHKASLVDRLRKME